MWVNSRQIRFHWQVQTVRLYLFDESDFDMAFMFHVTEKALYPDGQKTKAMDCSFDEGLFITLNSGM